MRYILEKSIFLLFTTMCLKTTNFNGEEDDDDEKMVPCVTCLKKDKVFYLIFCSIQMKLEDQNSETFLKVMKTFNEYL